MTEPRHQYKPDFSKGRDLAGNPRCQCGLTKHDPGHTGEIEKHDYEPDHENLRYRGDPPCRICGFNKRTIYHF